VTFEVRPAQTKDVEAYAKHCAFHLTEKGIGGVFVHPFPADHKVDTAEKAQNLLKDWSLPPFSPGWEIVWLAFHGDRVVGHLDLQCGGIKAVAHRMKLGMGIENKFRSQGLGTRLLTEALTWARDQKQIHWIDLGVFAQNTAARKLYRKFGFQETHTVVDAIRINGQSIDDIQMTLRIR
jgi:RimJ/RimL family protein N-acetyltransferase